MKKTGYKIWAALVLALAVVAALLLVRLREPREAENKSPCHRPATNATPAQTRSVQLKSNADDKAQAPTIDIEQNEAPVLDPTPPESPASSNTPSADATTPQEDQTEAPATTEPYVGAASFSCVVPKGGAMLTGGWTTPDGRQSFALISPVLTPETDGHSVTLSAQLFEMPAEQLADPRWASLVGPSEEEVNLRGASLNADEVAALREDKIPRITSSSTLGTLVGHYAALKVTGASDGLMLGLIAKQADDGSGIELSVSVAEYKGLDTPADEPNQE